MFNVNNVEINNDTPQWQNYFQCGFLGLVEHLKIQSAARGMKCMVDGTVPRSSGLSSSSALVCCAALVTMHANGKSLPKVMNITFEDLFIQQTYPSSVVPTVFSRIK